MGGQVLLLQKGSEEYLQIAHLLQLSVRSTNIQDISIWSISNPSLSLAFERRSSDLLSLDSWVDVNGLDDDNPIQEICNRGFVTPEGTNSGLLFRVGNIDFSHSHAGQTQQQYLLCTVAVGRSYVVDSSSEKSVADYKRPPPTYDSLYIHSDKQDSELQSADAGAYHHDYVVFDGTQVLPRYVVHFTYDPTVPLERKPVGNINLMEIKSKISDALSVLGPAAAVATESMLSNIEEKYTAALAAAQNPDALFEERRRSILEALAIVDGRLLAIQNNAKAVEEEIYKRVQEAIFALQDETAKKMNALLAEELELRRQLGQLDWVDSFTTLMAESLPLMSFVTAWERHSTLRQSLHSSLGGPVMSKHLDRINDDIRVRGKLEIQTGDAIPDATPETTTALTTVPTGDMYGTGSAGLAMRPSEAGRAWDRINSVFKHSFTQEAMTGNVRGAYASLTMNSVASPVADAVDRDSVFFSRAVNSSVPIVTLRQAEAELARAKADLEAIELAIDKSGKFRTKDSLAFIDASTANINTPSLSVSDVTAAKKDALNRIMNLEERIAYFQRNYDHMENFQSGATMDNTASAAIAGGTTQSSSSYSRPVGHSSSSPPMTSYKDSNAHASDYRPPSSALSTLTALNHVTNTSTYGNVPGGSGSGSGGDGNNIQPYSQGNKEWRDSVPLVPSPSYNMSSNTLNAADTTNLLTRTLPESSRQSAQNQHPHQHQPRKHAMSSRLPSLSQRLSRFSLAEEASRRKRQRGPNDTIPSSWMFAGSTLLNHEQAEILYNALPSFSSDNMNTASMQHTPSMHSDKIPPYARLINAYYGMDTRGGVGALLRKYREEYAGTSTVVIIRANGEIFGGYAADPWDCTGFYGGTPRSFLFSVTKDTKIPFHGRVKGPAQSNDAYLKKKHDEASHLVAQDFQMLLDEARAVTGTEPVFDAAGKLQLPQVDENGREFIMSIPVPRPKPFVRYDALRSTPDTIQWGLEDLVLTDDLTNCHSILEHSYGVGFTKEEAKTFLANATYFSVEALEFWSITPANSIPSLVPGKGSILGSSSELSMRAQTPVEASDRGSMAPPTPPMDFSGSSRALSVSQGAQGYLDTASGRHETAGVVGAGIGIGSGYDQSRPDSAYTSHSDRKQSQSHQAPYPRSHINTGGAW